MGGKTMGQEGEDWIGRLASWIDAMLLRDTLGLDCFCNEREGALCFCSCC